METTKYIWLNGKLVQWENAQVHIISHSLHYGSGVFEGIRAYNTEKGTAVFRLKEHIDRLFFSAGVMGMELPYSKADLIEATRTLLRENKVGACYIRPLAHFGYGVMNVLPINAPIDVSIACWPWGAYLPFEMVDVKIVSHIRLSPKSVHPEAKVSGHYVNGILAASELKGTKYHEALLLDENGYMAEGTGENVFYVKNGELYTPQLGSILAGITRNAVIKFATDLNIKVHEGRLLPKDFYEADEAFFTGTAAEVTPIRSIDDHVLASGEHIGEVTKLLKNKFIEAISGKNYCDWLAYVND